MHGRLLFLGTGGSMGVPVIGCECPVCTSENPRNARLRAAALVELQGRRLLIDCGPDFRQQALKHHLGKLDGALITHSHHDHTASIDELRVYSMRSGKAFPCLASEETKRELEMRFPYIFDKSSKRPSLTPKIAIETLKEERGIYNFLGVKIGFSTYEQGGTQVNGFRFGSFAYVTDIKHYSDTLFEDLKGVERLVISALRFSKSPIHLSIDEAIAFCRRVQVKKAWLTHIAHELDHEKTNAYLPDDIKLAYDGLTIDFQGYDE